MARTLYRIVRTNPPTLGDFLSNLARGRDLTDPTPERLRLWGGLSTWATEAQARRSARRHPGSGSFIAELVIPDDSRVEIEKTLGPGHHTVWGEPTVLLSYVRAARRVGE